MTDKDKLVKLYDFLKHDVEVSFLDGDVIDVAMDVISKHIEMIKKLEKQNKRYREIIQDFIDYTDDYNIPKAEKYRLRKALESESEWKFMYF